MAVLRQSISSTWMSKVKIIFNVKYLSLRSRFVIGEVNCLSLRLHNFEQIAIRDINCQCNLFRYGSSGGSANIYGGVGEEVVGIYG